MSTIQGVSTALEVIAAADALPLRRASSKTIPSSTSATTTPPAPQAPIVDIWGAAKRGDLVMLMNNQGGLNRDDWSEKDDRGNTALYYSCLCGHLDVCHFLLLMMGGIGLVPEEELQRHYTNALTAEIRDLLSGAKTYEDIIASRKLAGGGRRGGDEEAAEPVQEGEGEEDDYSAFSIFEGEDEVEEEQSVSG